MLACYALIQGLAKRRPESSGGDDLSRPLPGKQKLGREADLDGNPRAVVPQSMSREDTRHAKDLVHD